MPFESRVFQLAKDPQHPEQCEDAYRADPAAGIAVLADGVTSAIFSRQWAAILTDATLAEPPNPNDPADFARWLAERRQTWSGQINVSELAWFQKAKLPLGAFSTLLWVELLPVEQQQEGAFGAYRLRSAAIGDSCLFHVRHGAVLRSFPITCAAELEADPLVLGSVDLSRDQLLKFEQLDELCYPGDLLVLCTDAIAGWALHRVESGDPPDWGRYWDMTEAQWQEEISSLRDQREMRYDDATLVLLRVVAEGVDIGQPDSATVTTESGPQRPAAAPDEPESVGTPDQWKQILKSTGRQLTEGVDRATDQVMRGWRKWKQRAIEKYREKRRREQK